MADRLVSTTATTRNLWCGSRLCALHDSDGAMLRRYLPMGEYWPQTGAKYVYMQDQLGSVRDVLDATTGELVAAPLDYSPYGDQLRTWGDVSPAYQFAGRQWLDTTGLYLSVTRPYDPVLGRFIQCDPIREAGGINLYGYVGGSPVKWRDPSGLCAEGDQDCIKPVYPDLWLIGGIGGGGAVRSIFRTVIGVIRQCLQKEEPPKQNPLPKNFKEPTNPPQEPKIPPCWVASRQW